MQQLVKLSFFILLLLFVYSFFIGITTLPYPGDSIDYHIPIAQSILNGSFLHLSHPKNVLMYYPGASDAILSIFLLLHIPLNLFGLLSWVFLFFVCKKLGETFGLSKEISFIFSASIVTTLSVIREIPTQSIDIWLAVFFVSSILLLEKLNRKPKTFLLLGFFLGMLVGSKYSGPLFLLPIVIVYGKKILKNSSAKNIFLLLLPFCIFGLFWYVRNLIITGSPLYPGGLLMFHSAKNFPSMEWMTWKVILFSPQRIPVLLNALISEFHIWSLSFLVVLWYLLKKGQKTFQGQFGRLMLLTILTFIMCLALPITTPYNAPLFHTLSDMRYLYPFIIPAVLSVFLIAKQYKKEGELALLAVISLSFSMWGQLMYLPKLFVGVLLVIVVFRKFFEETLKRFLNF